MQSILFWSATSLYALATAAFFLGLAFRQQRAATWGVSLAAVALLPHAAAIALRWQEVSHGPYSTRYEVLSANAWLLVAAFLLSTRFARAIRSLGVFVMPAAFLMMGWAVASFGVKNEVPIIFKSYWLFLHIFFAKLFGASIVLAAACGTAYLIKSRNQARLPQLPGMERLDLYGHQFLLLGFLFLAVMIVAGSLWARQSWGRYWAWDPIETSALVTWIVLGIILHFRVLHRWSGKRMAYLSLLALACTLATVYIVTIVTPTIHNSYMVAR